MQLTCEHWARGSVQKMNEWRLNLILEVRGVIHALQWAIMFWHYLCWLDEDDHDPTIKTKKPGDETSDEEKEWLSALEKGELDDYGEISKGEKDPSLMTARQVLETY